ncbi:g1517 [Coccomyxa elongata]
MKALIASPHALLEPRVAKLAQRGSVPDGLHNAAQRAKSSLKIKVTRKRRSSVPLNAAALAPEVEASPAIEDLPSSLEQETQKELQPFNWAKQWYPMAFVQDLNAKVPHPVELLSQRLVLWCDGEGEWRCFQDKCPHRLAPLSEGRIEPSDGTLMCSYHGWRFDGDGKCTDIPQSLDAKANAAAYTNPRSCAVSHPTKVLQGRVWVWGEGGPRAFIDSAAVQPAYVPELAVEEGIRHASGAEAVYFSVPYTRDFPYAWDVLAENLLDPSHVNFSHHGVIGNRYLEESGLTNITAGPEPAAAPSPRDTLSMEVESWVRQAGKVDKWVVQFIAPCLIQWKFTVPWGNQNVLNLYMVPTAPGRCRALVDMHTPAKGMPLLAYLALKYLKMPSWFIHLTSSNVILDGDTALLHWQGHVVAKEAQQGRSWRKAFFMPTPADRYVAKFRQWVDERGGGGPTQYGPDSPLPPLETRKEVVLDRWNGHTKHCSHCQKGYRAMQVAQIVAAALGTLCTLSLSAALGRGIPLLSRVPSLLGAGALLCIAAWFAAKTVEQKFIFEDYNHSHKH